MPHKGQTNIVLLDNSAKRNRLIWLQRHAVAVLIDKRKYGLVANAILFGQNLDWLKVRSLNQVISKAFVDRLKFVENPLSLKNV